MESGSGALNCAMLKDREQQLGVCILNGKDGVGLQALGLCVWTVWGRMERVSK